MEKLVLPQQQQLLLLYLVNSNLKCTQAPSSSCVFMWASTDVFLPPLSRDFFPVLMDKLIACKMGTEFQSNWLVNRLWSIDKKFFLLFRVTVARHYSNRKLNDSTVLFCCSSWRHELDCITFGNWVERLITSCCCRCTGEHFHCHFGLYFLVLLSAICCSLSTYLLR